MKIHSITNHSDLLNIGQIRSAGHLNRLHQTMEDIYTLNECMDVMGSMLDMVASLKQCEAVCQPIVSMPVVLPVEEEKVVSKYDSYTQVDWNEHHIHKLFNNCDGERGRGHTYKKLVDVPESCNNLIQKKYQNKNCQAKQCIEMKTCQGHCIWYDVNNEDMPLLQKKNRLYLSHMFIGDLKRLVFDIEIEKLDSCNEARVIMNKHYQTALDIIMSVFGCDIINTYCSSGMDKGSYKLSLHLYTDVFVGELQTMKKVIQTMKDNNKNNRLVQKIDTQIYGENAKLRMPYSAKYDSDRYKHDYCDGCMSSNDSCSNTTTWMNVVANNNDDVDVVYARQLYIDHGLVTHYELLQKHPKWSDYVDSEHFKIDAYGEDLNSYSKRFINDMIGEGFYKSHTVFYGSDSVSYEDVDENNTDIVVLNKHPNIKSLLLGNEERRRQYNSSDHCYTISYMNKRDGYECPVCNVVHDRDNTIYVRYRPDDKCFWINCYRKHGGIMYQMEGYEKKKLTVEQQLILAKKTCCNSEMEQYAQKHSHCIEEQIQYSMLDDSSKQVLFVKAYMGTGKTTKLFEKLNTMSPCVYVYVSFRRTLSNEMLNKLGEYDNINATSYMDGCDKFMKQLDINKVNVCIVQFESLYRAWELLKECSLQINLIMDEYVSLLEQITCKLVPQMKTGNIQTLQTYIDRSQKIVILDAMLQPLHVELWKKHFHLRSKQIYIALFTVQPLVKKTVNRYEGDMVLSLLKQGKRVIYCSNKKRFCKELYYRICNEYRCLILTGDDKVQYEGQPYHNAQMKDNVFQNVNGYLEENDIQCFIYSPTIVAGVSIELQQYQDVVCEFGNNSCSIEACIQMIGRTRNCKNLYIDVSSCKQSRDVVMSQKVVDNNARFMHVNDAVVQKMLVDIYHQMNAKDTMLIGIFKYLYTTCDVNEYVEKGCAIEKGLDNDKIIIREQLNEMTSRKDAGEHIIKADTLLHSYDKIYQHLERLHKGMSKEELLELTSNYIQNDLHVYTAKAKLFRQLQLGEESKDMKLHSVYNDLQKYKNIIQIFADEGVDIYEMIIKGGQVILSNNTVNKLRSKISNKWVTQLQKMMMFTDEVSGKQKIHRLTFAQLGLYMKQVELTMEEQFKLIDNRQ